MVREFQSEGILALLEARKKRMSAVLNFKTFSDLNLLTDPCKSGEKILILLQTIILMNSFEFQQSESSIVNQTPYKALLLPFVAERIKTSYTTKSYSVGLIPVVGPKS